jgi:hypothetical protein
VVRGAAPETYSGLSPWAATVGVSQQESEHGLQVPGLLDLLELVGNRLKTGRPSSPISDLADQFVAHALKSPRVIGSVMRRSVIHVCTSQQVWARPRGVSAPPGPLNTIVCTRPYRGGSDERKGFAAERWRPPRRVSPWASAMTSTSSWEPPRSPSALVVPRTWSTGGSDGTPRSPDQSPASRWARSGTGPTSKPGLDGLVGSADY